MKPIVSVSCLLCLLAGPSLAPAGDGPIIKPYASGSVSGSLMESDSGGFNQLGGGFANTGSDDTEVLGLGGAVGVAADFTSFRTRVEVEGMWREDQELVTNSFLPTMSVYQVQADSNWSVLGNLWVDVPVAKYFAIYGGGGIGGAGGQLTVNDGVVAGTAHDQGLAYQLGGGLIAQLTDHVELDLGYRFLDMDDSEITIETLGQGNTVGNYTLDQESHTVMLTLRVLLP